jgi:hypothetical protein
VPRRGLDYYFSGSGPQISAMSAMNVPKVNAISALMGRLPLMISLMNPPPN